MFQTCTCLLLITVWWKLQISQNEMLLWLQLQTVITITSPSNWFDNFCIILKRSVCSLLWDKYLKMAKKHHCHSLQKVGSRTLCMTRNAAFLCHFQIRYTVAVFFSSWYVHCTFGSMLAQGTGWLGFFFLKVVAMVPNISSSFLLALSVSSCVCRWPGCPWMMDVLPAGVRELLLLLFSHFIQSKGT